MGIVSKLKGFLPPSSRSFHAMWKDVVARIGASEMAIYRYIDYKFDHVAEEEFTRLEGLIEGYGQESSQLLWQIYCQEDESLDDARRRFFRRMPRATGALRVLQKANAQLLAEFSALCKLHDVEWFLTAGTLLGSLRHEGSIPWDDDTDVGLERSQLRKLIEVVRDRDEYAITVVYDQNVFCKQIRFKWAHADVPCFIDLFPYDYSIDRNLKNAETHAELRAKLVDAIRAIVREDERVGSYLPAEDPLGRLVEGLYDRALSEAVECGLVVPKEDATSIMWGLDNIPWNDGVNPIMPLDWIFPLIDSFYENAAYPAPARAQRCLESWYGDWMRMPHDRSLDIVHTGSIDARGLEQMRRRAGLPAD